MTIYQNFPRWLKRLGKICAVLAVLDVVALLLLWVPCYTKGCDMLGEAILTAFVLAPLLAIIAALWVIIAILYRFCGTKPWFNKAIFATAVIFTTAIVLLVAYSAINLFFHPSVERQATPAIPIKTGILQGRVTQGPICPVETMPPDPRCAPKGYATDILVSGGGFTTPKLISTDAEGYFTALLSPGTYLLSAGGENSLPKCEAMQVEINLQQTSNVDISCDTGIR